METAALTRGSIPPQLVSLALPLIFGNILQQLYNTIDAMVIGRFAGETAFAAIGVAGTVMNLFLFLLSGCCTGISVLFAQQYGSRDLAGFRQEGFLASVFGGLFTLVLSLAALLLLRPLLTLMQTPEDVAGWPRTIWWSSSAACWPPSFTTCAPPPCALWETPAPPCWPCWRLWPPIWLWICCSWPGWAWASPGRPGPRCWPSCSPWRCACSIWPGAIPSSCSAGRTGGWTGACSAGR